MKSKELSKQKGLKIPRAYKNVGGGTRLYGLDIFRIILAFEILMFHSNGHLGCSYGTIINLFLRAGAVTMTAFFILSGYVNQHSYGNRNYGDGREIRRFICARLISIMPTYYFVAIMYNFLFSKLSLKDHVLLMPTEIMGFQSIFTSLFSVGHNSGTWFVSCIIICYAIFPLISVLANSLSEKEVVWIIIGLTALLFYLPIVRLRFELSSLYTNPFIRVLEYAIGVLMATTNMEKTSKKTTTVFFCLWIFSSIALVLYIKKYGILNDYMIYNIFFLPIWIIVIFLMGKLKISGNVTYIISFFSNISYDMFLVQFFTWPIVRKVDEAFKLNNISMIIIVFVICIGLSTIIHYSFEKPVRIFLKKNFLERGQ